MSHKITQKLLATVLQQANEPQTLKQKEQRRKQRQTKGAKIDTRTGAVIKPAKRKRRENRQAYEDHNYTRLDELMDQKKEQARLYKRNLAYYSQKHQPSTLEQQYRAQLEKR
ncbi:hypothetical protein H4R35_005585 [Dimargaris xerosporica]|nr:hypothetical protein H4R35_005585 [Dimargaris xerosporica]